MSTTFFGHIQPGIGKARALGFPTINIPLSDSTASGSYIARVHVDGVGYPAAAYANQLRHVLEAHFLEFPKKIDSNEVSVELIQKIRDDQYFTDDETLRAAIAGDVAMVKKYFNLD
jgi:riboflavin kinase/FMN adenylyltransferase